VQSAESDLLVGERCPVVRARREEPGASDGQIARPRGILIVDAEQGSDADRVRVHGSRRRPVSAPLAEEPHRTLLRLRPGDRPVGEDEHGCAVIGSPEEVRDDEHETRVGRHVPQKLTDPLVRRRVDPERGLGPDGEPGAALGSFPRERRQVADEVDARALEVAKAAAKEVVHRQVELGGVVARLDRRDANPPASLTTGEDEGGEEEGEHDGSRSQGEVTVARFRDDSEGERVIDGHEGEGEGPGAGERPQAGGG